MIVSLHVNVFVWLVAGFKLCSGVLYFQVLYPIKYPVRWASVLLIVNSAIIYLCGRQLTRLLASYRVDIPQILNDFFKVLSRSWWCLDKKNCIYSCYESSSDCGSWFMSHWWDLDLSLLRAYWIWISVHLPRSDLPVLCILMPSPCIESSAYAAIWALHHCKFRLCLWMSQTKFSSAALCPNCADQIGL